MARLFVDLKVWRRDVDGVAVLYRCLRDDETGRYAVQSADFFRLPVDGARIESSDRQFVELLIEQSPLERCEWHPSVAAAIAAHERAFG